MTNPSPDYRAGWNEALEAAEKRLGDCLVYCTNTASLTALRLAPPPPAEDAKSERRTWEDAIDAAVATLNEEHAHMLLSKPNDARRYGIALASQIVESMRDSGPAEETEVCPECKGTGQHPEALPGAGCWRCCGTGGTKACASCGGKGVIDPELPGLCADCHGSGRVPLKTTPAIVPSVKPLPDAPGWWVRICRERRGATVPPYKLTNVASPHLVARYEGVTWYGPLPLEKP